MLVALHIKPDRTLPPQRSIHAVVKKNINMTNAQLEIQNTSNTTQSGTTAVCVCQRKPLHQFPQQTNAVHGKSFKGEKFSSWIQNSQFTEKLL